MPKKAKLENPVRKPRCFYMVYPWECRHHEDHSKIIAYVEGNDWETVAEIRNTSGASAETMATFLCSLINENQERRRLLLDAMAALQTCLDEDGLTFTSEQAADSVLNRIKNKVGEG